MTIIVGFGFVGQAVYGSLSGEACIVDPKRGVTMQSPEVQRFLNPNSTHFHINPTIVVCVGTPSAEDGGCDIGAFAQVWDEVKDYEGLIIIKSTLPKEMIPKQINVVYNPEFLQANTANDDFRNQEYIVLGGEMDWTKKAEDWYKNSTTLDYNTLTFEHCTRDEASDFKYLRNIYNAYDVMFWEYVQDITGNARKISNMMENLPIGANSNVGMDGYRGFGGACLPKDTKAYHDIHEHKLTDFLLTYNKDLNDF